MMSSCLKHTLHHVCGPCLCLCSITSVCSNLPSTNTNCPWCLVTTGVTLKSYPAFFTPVLLPFSISPWITHSHLCSKYSLHVLPLTITFFVSCFKISLLSIPCSLIHKGIGRTSKLWFATFSFHCVSLSTNSCLFLEIISVGLVVFIKILLNLASIKGYFSVFNKKGSLWQTCLCSKSAGSHITNHLFCFLHIYQMVLRNKLW